MAEEKKPKKERVKKKYPMPEQPPEERIHNFNEVPIGQTEDVIKKEAQRCLQCKPSEKRKLCYDGCPVGIDIPAFIKKIQEDDLEGAIGIIKRYNNLPAVCGRVCPYENQCEGNCVVGKIKDSEPVAIGRMERFLADWERARGVKAPELPPRKDKKVAVVGSGPAGLTVAADLAKKGYQVTLFEALHSPGGVLVYGIPEFRLPKAIVRAEVSYIETLGVKLVTDAVVGKSISMQELSEQNDAIFVATGAGLPKWMNIPGENLNGILSANEFLTRANLMKSYMFPDADTPNRIGKKVATIGGGNVAMDCARTSLRLGAEESWIIYRRTETELPARIEEVHHAMQEGVKFQFLTAPVKYEGDETGYVKKMECCRMKLGEPDASGRRRPLVCPGENFELDVDTVLIAIGQSPNPIVPQTTPEIKTTKWGTIVVDDWQRTSMKGVFAAGDIATGDATVILAMGGGKRAAEAMDRYLSENEDWPAPETWEQ
ncbi:MAG TPA: NADPH-dependent glutamate synthase [Euryarchaeota archaeon]|nr:NADPH-dependent glutamate synthase [Euryarchaeota archaeon]